MRLVGLGDRPFPRARREFGTSIAPCRVVRCTSRAAIQQRRVDRGQFTRRTLIFRFKSIGEEKWTGGQPNLSVVIILYFPTLNGAISLDGLQKPEKRKTEERTGTSKLYFTRSIVQVQSKS